MHQSAVTVIDLGVHSISLAALGGTATLSLTIGSAGAGAAVAAGAAAAAALSASASRASAPHLQNLGGQRPCEQVLTHQSTVTTGDTLTHCKLGVAALLGACMAAAASADDAAAALAALVADASSAWAPHLHRCFGQAPFEQTVLHQ